jgi:hypothetical protein
MSAMDVGAVRAPTIRRSLSPTPAYPDTSVALRALVERVAQVPVAQPRLTRLRRFLETC